MLYMATMLATGLYSIHCLIPPQPGAMAAVSLIKPNIGELILLGLGIAVPAAVAGFAWARFACRNEPRSRARPNLRRCPGWPNTTNGKFQTQFSLVARVVPTMIAQALLEKTDDRR
jgi:GntP family gluconate:H+ symporter